MSARFRRRSSKSARGARCSGNRLSAGSTPIPIRRLYAERHHLRSRVADESDRDNQPRHEARRTRHALVERSHPAVDSRWRGRDREDVTIRSLLTHSSGLTIVAALFRDHTGRQEFQHAICSLPLEYPPDSQEIYSDLGFMLLGFIVEDAGRQSFQSQAPRLLGTLTTAPLMFNPPAALRSSIAPTENDPWRGRRLVGEVHDENCWALGGAAGHAGLFGTAQAVGDVARVILGALAGSDSRLASAEPFGFS